MRHLVIRTRKTHVLAHQSITKCTYCTEQLLLSEISKCFYCCQLGLRKLTIN